MCKFVTSVESNRIEYNRMLPFEIVNYFYENFNSHEHVKNYF